MEKETSSKHLNKNVPKLRFPEFVGEWETVKLSDFSERVTRKNADNKTNIPLTISSKDGLVNQVSYFSKTVASKDMSGYYLLKKGEFAYNKSYSVGYDFGSIKRLDRYPMGALSTLYICFGITKYDSDFLNIYFDSLKWYQEIYMIAAEGARNHGLLNVSTEDFFETRHTIPIDIEEQRKIAAFFNLLNTRITKQCELVEKLKTYKRGVLEALIKPKATWKKTTFGESCYDFSYGMNAAAVQFDGKHKYIRITDIDDSSHLYIQDEIVSPNTLPEEKYRVKSGDILFARTGASVGKSYIYAPCDGELYYAGFLIRVSVKEEYDCRFVYYQTLSKNYEKWVQLTSARSGQPGINAEEYKTFDFYAPDLSEQQSISSFLSKIDEYINKQTEYLDKLTSIKSGLLRQMFI